MGLEPVSCVGFQAATEPAHRKTRTLGGRSWNGEIDWPDAFSISHRGEYSGAIARLTAEWRLPSLVSGRVGPTRKPRARDGRDIAFVHFFRRATCQYAALPTPSAVSGTPGASAEETARCYLGMDLLSRGLGPEHQPRVGVVSIDADSSKSRQLRAPATTLPEALLLSDPTLSVPAESAIMLAISPTNSTRKPSSAGYRSMRSIRPRISSSASARSSGSASGVWSSATLRR
jgi:hypothetical protein